MAAEITAEILNHEACFWVLTQPVHAIFYASRCNLHMCMKHASGCKCLVINNLKKKEIGNWNRSTVPKCDRFLYKERDRLKNKEI